MQFKKKTIPLAGAIALAMAGIAAAAEEQTVKIGHVGPFSGNNAYIGNDSENGARIAIDELNAKGHRRQENQVRTARRGRRRRSETRHGCRPEWH